jgi:PAS domain S-box-containing protein
MKLNIENLSGLFFQGTSDLMMFLDPLGRIIEINPAGLNFSGFSKEEIIGKLFWKLPGVFSKKNLPKYLKVFKNSLKGIPTHNFTSDLTNKQGIKHIMDFSTYPIKEQNKIASILVIGRDITTEYEIKQALIESEQKFKDLSENAKDSIAIYTSDGVVSYANKQTEILLGLKRSELKDKDLSDLVAPSEVPKLIKNFKNRLEGKSVPNLYETIAINKEGKRIPIEVTIAKTIWEKKPAVIAIVRDITKRKDMEKKLHRSFEDLEKRVADRTNELATANMILKNEIYERKKIEEETKKIKDYLQNVINSASEIIFALDFNKRITTWNNTIERLTGFKSKEIIGKSVTKLNIIDNKEILIDYLESVQNGHLFNIDELIFNTKEDRKVLVRSSSSIVQGVDNKPIGILFVGKDITKELDLHGKLIPGDSYLILEEKYETALNIFTDLMMSGHNGLLITRNKLNSIYDNFTYLNVNIALLNQERIKGLKNISNPEELVEIIDNFIEKESKPLILLNRIDYLITQFSFESVMKALYRINNIVADENAIFLLRLNPSLINTSQLAILKEEIQMLPSQRIEDIEIDGKFYNILKFINEQKKNNLLVSYSRINKECNLSKVTTGKYLRKLENSGLIYIKKQGRLKIVNLTEKGIILLQKRNIL